MKILSIPTIFGDEEEERERVRERNSSYRLSFEDS
jgi:hypothetical protein